MIHEKESKPKYAEIKKGIAPNKTSIYIRKSPTENVITDTRLLIVNHKTKLVFDALKFGFMSIIPDGDYIVDIHNNHYDAMLFPNYQEIIARVQAECTRPVVSTSLSFGESLIVYNGELGYSCVNTATWWAVFELVKDTFGMENILTNEDMSSFYLPISKEQNMHIVLTGTKKYLVGMNKFLKG